MFACPLHRADSIIGLGRRRFFLFLLFFCGLAQPLDIAPVLHIETEHLQGPAAGVDLVVMGQIGKAFQNSEQLIVPGAAPDLHIAGTALRTERPESGELVAALRGWARSEAVESAHQMKRLALAGLARIWPNPMRTRLPSCSAVLRSKRSTSPGV